MNTYVIFEKINDGPTYMAWFCMKNRIGSERGARRQAPLAHIRRGGDRRGRYWLVYPYGSKTWNGCFPKLDEAKQAVERKLFDFIFDARKSALGQKVGAS